MTIEPISKVLEEAETFLSNAVTWAGSHVNSTR